MRAGYSLVEALAAIVAGSLVTAMLAATLVVQTRAAAATARSAETGEAVAQAAAVLGAETRELIAADRSVGGDSLALRAFRATALVCDTAGGHALVRWSGSRNPDAAKDSAVVLRGPAAWVIPIETPVALPDEACMRRSGERLFRIASLGALRRADVLLVFERGDYHLANRALRWRVGAAGRQPLTAEVFDDAASGFRPGPPALLRLVTRPAHARDAAAAWSVPLLPLDPEAGWP